MPPLRYVLPPLTKNPGYVAVNPKTLAIRYVPRHLLKYVSQKVPTSNRTSSAVRTSVRTAVRAD